MGSTGRVWILPSREAIFAWGYPHAAGDNNDSENVFADCFGIGGAR